MAYRYGVGTIMVFHLYVLIRLKSIKTYNIYPVFDYYILCVSGSVKI